MDAKAARYAATVRVQTARTETIADLGGMVVELLKTFFQTVRALDSDTKPLSKLHGLMFRDNESRPHAWS